MSYHPARTTAASLDGVADLGVALKHVAEDPCLFKVVERVIRLHRLEQPPAPTKPGAPPPPVVKGVGMCAAVKPLDAVIYLKQNKWVLPVAGAVLFAGLFGLGYHTGRRASKGSR